MQIEKPRSYSIIWQTTTILLLSTAIGLLMNQVRPGPLPLVADWDLEAQMTTELGEGKVISFAEARDFFLSGEAVFIDARSPEVYQQGHIFGARNLPWESVDDYCDVVMADIPQDAMIITYCDGEGCDLNKELALELLYHGYQNIRVLANGWSLWVEHQLPMEGLSLDVSGGRK